MKYYQVRQNMQLMFFSCRSRLYRNELLTLTELKHIGLSEKTNYLKLIECSSKNTYKTKLSKKDTARFAIYIA